LPTFPCTASHFLWIVVENVRPLPHKSLVLGSPTVPLARVMCKHLGSQMPLRQLEQTACPFIPESSQDC
jgi:hypothetical protein